MRAFLAGTVAPLARRRGKESFLRSLSPGQRLLDVGCGNSSPIRARQCAPAIHYTGLDIGDYNQRPGSVEAADEYLITSPSEFAATIEGLAGSFDAVISSHNLEHCSEPQRVLAAICRALKPHGRLYLSFPSEASVRLPRRKYNTLNFFDDPTHTTPPKLEEVLSILQAGGLRTDFVRPRYRPVLPFCGGLVLEPISYLTKRAMPFGTTWSLYGFETVIWATRR